jgi:restriction endonuclease Mrr
VFEQLVAEFFAGWGYDEVRLMGRNSTTAADIFALRKIQPNGTDLRMFVETKRWKDRVGVEVIDRVYGAFLAEKPSFGWHMAMVVTVGRFSQMKKHTSESLSLKGITLKDGDDVRKWLTDYRFKDNGLWLPDLNS